MGSSSTTRMPELDHIEGTRPHDRRALNRVRHALTKVGKQPTSEGRGAGRSAHDTQSHGSHRARQGARPRPGEDPAVPALLARRGRGPRRGCAGRHARRRRSPRRRPGGRSPSTASPARGAHRGVVDRGTGRRAASTGGSPAAWVAAGRARRADRDGHAAGRRPPASTLPWPRSTARRCSTPCSGPAADGGWWALGLRRPDPGVFLGVPTSRPDTGSRQRARLGALGLRTVTCAASTRDRRRPRTTRSRRPLAHAAGSPPASRCTAAWRLVRPCRAASGIDLAVDRWRADADRPSRRLLAALPDPVLDVGCGPGRSSAARRRGPHRPRVRPQPRGRRRGRPARRARCCAARCSTRCPASAGGAPCCCSTATSASAATPWPAAPHPASCCAPAGGRRRGRPAGHPARPLTVRARVGRRGRALVPMGRRRRRRLGRSRRGGRAAPGGPRPAGPLGRHRGPAVTSARVEPSGGARPVDSRCTTGRRLGSASPSGCSFRVCPSPTSHVPQHQPAWLTSRPARRPLPGHPGVARRHRLRHRSRCSWPSCGWSHHHLLAWPPVRSSATPSSAWPSCPLVGAGGLPAPLRHRQRGPLVPVDLFFPGPLLGGWVTMGALVVHVGAKGPTRRALARGPPSRRRPPGPTGPSSAEWQRRRTDGPRPPAAAVPCLSPCRSSASDGRRPGPRVSR